MSDSRSAQIRAGLDWLRGNLAELGVKNRDIVVSGHSSGGIYDNRSNRRAS